MIEFFAALPLRGVGSYTAWREGKVVSEYSYLLVQIKGNYQLVFFRERDGNPMGDAESSLVSFALGKNRKNDLLFQGGDFPNEPYRAFRRVVDSGEE